MCYNLPNYSLLPPLPLLINSLTFQERTTKQVRLPNSPLERDIRKNSCCHAREQNQTSVVVRLCCCQAQTNRQTSLEVDLDLDRSHIFSWTFTLGWSGFLGKEYIHKLWDRHMRPWVKIFCFKGSNNLGKLTFSQKKSVIPGWLDGPLCPWISYAWSGGSKIPTKGDSF